MTFTRSIFSVGLVRKVAKSQSWSVAQEGGFREVIVLHRARFVPAGHSEVLDERAEMFSHCISLT